MPTGTQLLAQLAPQHPTRLDEQRQIDRLVRDPHRRIILVGPAQPPRNLLRRPPTLKLLLHDPAQPRVERELRQLRATRTLPRRPLSTLRAVAPAITVTVDLPRDRRVRTTNRPPDRPKALTARQPARNLLALPQRQTPLGALARRRSHAPRHSNTRGHVIPCHPYLARDRVQRVPLDPQLPHPLSPPLRPPTHHHHLSLGQQPTRPTGRSGGAPTPSDHHQKRPRHRASRCGCFRRMGKPAKRQFTPLVLGHEAVPAPTPRSGSRAESGSWEQRRSLSRVRVRT